MHWWSKWLFDISDNIIYLWLFDIIEQKNANNVKVQTQTNTHILKLIYIVNIWNNDGYSYIELLELNIFSIPKS